MGERKIPNLLGKASLDIPRRRQEFLQAKPFWVEVWGKAFKRALPVLWHFGFVQVVVLGAIGFILVAYFTEVEWEQVKGEFWTNFFLLLAPAGVLYIAAVFWFTVTVPAMKFLEVTENLSKDVESLKHKIKELETNQEEKNTNLEAIERLEALYREGEQLLNENVGGTEMFLNWRNCIIAWTAQVANSLPQAERFGFETTGKWDLLGKSDESLGAGPVINTHVRGGKSYVDAKLTKLRAIIMRMSAA